MSSSRVIKKVTYLKVFFTVEQKQEIIERFKVIHNTISIIQDQQFNKHTFQFDGRVNFEDIMEDREDEFSLDSENAGPGRLLITH